MAHNLFDRVKETTTTTGTGTVTLAGAVTGFRSFTSVLASGDTTWYCITDGTNWEVGLGTFTTAGTTLARTTVLASSNANALVSFAAGSKDVFMSHPASAMGILEADYTIALTAFAANATPSATTDGTAHMFTRTIAGRGFPGWIGPSGLDYASQPLLARSKIGCFQPSPGLATLVSLGMTPVTVGTATAKTNASTNIYTQTSGVEFLVTVAATTAVAGFRNASAAAQLSMWRGNAAGLGGFTFICRFGLPTGVSTSAGTDRVFVGLSNLTAAPTDVNPSTLTANHNVGVGYDSADTNWQIMTNAAGVMAKTDTGIPVPTVNGNEVFEIALFCSPNGSVINYEFTLIGAGTKFSGSLSTSLPTNTIFMAPRAYHSAGGTSTVTGFGLLSLYTESDI